MKSKDSEELVSQPSFVNLLVIAPELFLEQMNFKNPIEAMSFKAIISDAVALEISCRETISERLITEEPGSAIEGENG